MPASKSIVLTFEIFRGEEFVRRQELQEESVTIGRGPAAMLRIEEGNLQDLQAVLNVNDDGTVQLLDLVGDGSTLVNGQPVSNVLLSTGDAVSFGELRVVVRITDAAAFVDDEATRVDAPVVAATAASAGAAGAAAAKAAPTRAPAEAASEQGEEDFEESEDAPVEDVMAFVMRASASANDAAGDRSQGKVLEVAQVFGDAVLEVRLFKRGQKVRVGSSVGTTVNFMGFPVGSAPEGAAKVVNMLPLLTASEGWKNPFYVPAEMLPQQDFPLFDSSGGGWVCNISEQWAGFVDQGENRQTFQEIIASGRARKGASGLYQIEIPEEGRLVVDLGSTLFMAHNVYPGKKAIANVWKDVDYPFLGIVAFMTFVAVMFFVAVAIVPPPPDTGMQELDPHLVELLLQKEEPPPEEKSPDAGEGAKAKKEEGKVGKEESKKQVAKGEKVLKKAQLDKEVAENAGLLGALRDDSSLDGSLGQTGLSDSMMQGIGGLIGSTGTQQGSGGLGGRGGGLGGGGTASGLGGMGTKGRGSGASGYGEGGGNFGSKGEGGLASVGGDAIVLGGLDKSLIDAVIKRNLAAIKYCYQRELTKNPSLGGKIVVKFVIAKDGTVSSATTKSSSMNSPAVETCINSRFMKFQFPEPKGGGIVIVSYPFIFSPG